MTVASACASEYVRIAEALYVVVRCSVQRGVERVEVKGLPMGFSGVGCSPAALKSEAL